MPSPHARAGWLIYATAPGRLHAPTFSILRALFAAISAPAQEPRESPTHASCLRQAFTPLSRRQTKVAG